MCSLFFFAYSCHQPQLVSHKKASSSAECSRDKPPFSFVRGQDSTMWDMVSPQGHRSVSVSRHFLLQAPQCPCSVRKWFSRDHCCWGRSKHPKNITQEIWQCSGKCQYFTKSQRSVDKKTCRGGMVWNFIFASILYFAEFVHFILVSDHTLLHSYLHHSQ